MNDASDEEIMQNLSIAFSRFSQRFGEDDLLAMLIDLVETLETKRVDGVPVQ